MRPEPACVDPGPGDDVDLDVIRRGAHDARFCWPEASLEVTAASAWRYARRAVLIGYRPVGTALKYKGAAVGADRARKFLSLSCRRLIELAGKGQMARRNQHCVRLAV